MKISEKEFSKYARPRFLTISRLFIYMFAIILLKDKGYSKAAQLVEDKFLERHKRKL